MDGHVGWARGGERARDKAVGTPSWGSRDSRGCDGDSAMYEEEPTDGEAVEVVAKNGSDAVEAADE